MIWELRHKHKISLLIEVSGLPRSTYYYYAKCRTASDKYSEIKEQITSIYAENKGRMDIAESPVNCTIVVMASTIRLFSGS